MKKISIVILLFTVLLFLLTGTFKISLSCYLPTSYYIYDMRKIIRRGEMGWGDNIERIFNFLRECKQDNQSLATRLLSDKDGTIVSLGMDLVVLKSLSNGDTMLSKYHDDTRWNFNMTDNGEYSKLSLARWKIRKNISLTNQDREILKRWPKTDNTYNF